MFERYTESARRAIFYARAVAVLNEASAIDSVHLLCGLMWGEDSRAQVLFGLREIFPLYRGCPHKSANVKLAMAVQGPPLSSDGKRVAARTAEEANALRDYWIDREHVVLGILAEPACPAARHLEKAGITLESARRVVMGSRPSRPEYGGDSAWRDSKSSPLKWVQLKWLAWKYRRRG
jgi:ATP-dependent Clp protease ATP-binding subunit ClpA